MRFKAHEASTDKVAEFFGRQKLVKTIFYPKLKTHPNHDIFVRDHKGANGMITIEFNDEVSNDEALKFVDNLKFFSIGASWGGYESLATVTVPPRTAADLSKRGVFVRFHIGLEDIDDLLADLRQAFDKIKTKGAK